MTAPLLALLAALAAAQGPCTCEAMMVPMRDGAQLQTVVMRPRDAAGVPGAAPDTKPGNRAALAKDG